MTEEDQPWMEDSDSVFKAISAGATNIQMAKNMMVALYMPDLSYSRAGLCHAVKRLERHYEELQS